MNIKKRSLVIMAFVICLIAFGIKLPAVYGGIFDNIKGFLSKDRNEVHLRLGQELSKAVGVNDMNITIATVNQENGKLDELNYYKTCYSQKAIEMQKEPPTDRAILQRIVDRKIKVDATRAMGLYPTSQEIESYVKEQREMSKDNADFKSLLGGWSISESKYYNLMTPIWADSIVIDKWYKQVVLQNISKPDDPEKG